MAWVTPCPTSSRCQQPCPREAPASSFLGNRQPLVPVSSEQGDERLGRFTWLQDSSLPQVSLDRSRQSLGDLDVSPPGDLHEKRLQVVELLGRDGVDSLACDRTDRTSTCPAVPRCRPRSWPVAGRGSRGRARTACTCGIRPGSWHTRSSHGPDLTRPASLSDRTISPFVRSRNGRRKADLPSGDQRGEPGHPSAGTRGGSPSSPSSPSSPP